MLLDFAPSGAEAIERILSSPALIREAKARLGDLKARATAKAHESGVREVVGRRFALYPQPNRTAAEWAAWWADYYACLADVSLCGLEAGMAAWVAKPDSQFLPKPGQLLELALSSQPIEIRAFDRARRAVVEGTTQRAISGPMVDRAEVERWAAEFAASVDAKAKAAPAFKPPQGKVDASGITPELRAVLARQRGEQA